MIYLFCLALRKTRRTLRNRNPILHGYIIPTALYWVTYCAAPYRDSRVLGRYLLPLESA